MKSLRLIVPVIVIGILAFSLVYEIHQKTTRYRGAAPEDSVSSTRAILKLAVFTDGRVMVDGKASTIPALRESLQRLREKDGIVWYYREAGQQSPPPIVTNVMEALSDTGCPMRLSNRPDYSDYIDEHGHDILAGGKP